MREIEIIVDNYVRIYKLSDPWINGLINLTSVKNEAKERAIKEHVWNARDLPDKISLAKYNSARGELRLPRGFLYEFLKMLDENGLKYNVRDKMVGDFKLEESSISSVVPDVLTDTQLQAAGCLIGFQQGRIIMPPGKGKTVLALGAIKFINKPTLIIVQQKHIAQQWVDRAKEHFDMNIGFIGDGKWDEKYATVALLQTLWSRKHDLETWFKQWHVVILDEQHHIPANTFTEIIQRFPAQKRFGISATVGKSEADKRISELIFGSILYETEDVNVKPSVQVVDTDFEFDYFPTKKYIKPNGRLGIRRNNYASLIKALVEDETRNAQIASYINMEPAACHLIVSDRLKHLDDLSTRVPLLKVKMLTGKEPLERRMEIYEEAEEGNCAIFSTIASEALDIPRIDRIHLCYPRRNIEAVWQIIGRGTRTHPDKNDCVIIDYRDKNVPVLRNQFNGRVRELYQPKNITVQLQISTSTL